MYPSRKVHIVLVLLRYTLLSYFFPVRNLLFSTGKVHTIWNRQSIKYLVPVRDNLFIGEAQLINYRYVPGWYLVVRTISTFSIHTNFRARSFLKSNIDTYGLRRIAYGTHFQGRTIINTSVK